MSKQGSNKKCETRIFETIIGGKTIYNVAVSFNHRFRGKKIGRVPASRLELIMKVNTKKQKIDLTIERDRIVLKIPEIIEHIHKNSIAVLYTDSDTNQFIIIFFTPELRKPEYEYGKQLDDLFERFDDNLSMVELIDFVYK